MTVTDIIRRKILTAGSINHMKEIYKSKSNSLTLNIRNFEIFSSSVFLYSSE